MSFFFDVGSQRVSRFLELEMDFINWNNSTSLKEIVKACIDFNINNNIWFHKWLRVTLVQENPQFWNFIINNNKILVIDFDLITISYIILQPIYIFIEIVLLKDYTYKQMLKIFIYIIFIFRKKNEFSEDFSFLWKNNLFNIYNKVFICWIEKNNDRMHLNKKILNNNKLFFYLNKKIIYNYL